MQSLRYFLLLLGIIYGSILPLLSQTNPIEICDNAIDDDGNGLIDLNDPACICQIVEPVSLIPNASFEENDCCPIGRSQMDCALDWIQASEATTDYIHTCGWLGWEDLPVPRPIPDGEGCLGFRNGRFGGNRTLAGWKEYAGACLTHPLEAGETYKFRFNIGFTHRLNSPPINVTFFGSTDCDNLPFGIGNENYGCPTNGSGWRRLSSVNVSGTNEWKLAELTVVPTVDIYAIAIGPPCQNAVATNSLYYFLDNLLLASEDVFNFKIDLVGNPCDDELTLELPEIDSISYQWYKEGITLLGETNARLSQLYGDGEYRVVIKSPNSECRSTPFFTFERPVSEKTKDIIICDGGSYFFDSQEIISPGIYTDTTQTSEGCDSITTLNLDVFYNTGDTIQAKIFPEEIYTVGDFRFYNPGEYTFDLTSQTGCDSTVFLILEHYKVFTPNAFTPNGDGVNDIFAVMGGEEVILIENMQIFNRWGNMIFEAQSLTPNDLTAGWDGTSKGKNAPEGVYVFIADLKYDDDKVRRTSGSISLIR